MAENKTIVLVTGANGGIGFELVAQLIEDPRKHVLLGSRSIEKGEAAIRDLHSRNHPGSVELIQLDVADEESILAAAEKVEITHGRYARLDGRSMLSGNEDQIARILAKLGIRLDALVNNAAVGWPGGSPGEGMAKCFQTNATGVYLVVEAFVPLLKNSIGTPRVINVTSGAGSVARRMDPNGPSYSIGMKGIQYGASKAAMNLITAYQAVVYGEQGFKIFAFSPGFVVSNLGPHNKAENGAQPTSVGAAPMIDIINGERDGDLPRNGFLRATSQSPW